MVARAAERLEELERRGPDDDGREEQRRLAPGDERHEGDGTDHEPGDDAVLAIRGGVATAGPVLLVVTGREAPSLRGRRAAGSGGGVLEHARLLGRRRGDRAASGGPSVGREGGAGSSSWSSASAPTAVESSCASSPSAKSPSAQSPASVRNRGVLPDRLDHESRSSSSEPGSSAKIRGTSPVGGSDQCGSGIDPLGSAAGCSGTYPDDDADQVAASPSASGSGNRPAAGSPAASAPRMRTPSPSVASRAALGLLVDFVVAPVRHLSPLSDLPRQTG